MTLFKKLSLLFCILGIGLGLSAPMYAYAQNTNQTEPPPGSQGVVPCCSFSDNPCQVLDIFTLAITIVNFMISFAGVVAVVAIVIAGYFMVTGAGNVEKITEAKKLLVGAVIGLFFVMAAMVLTNFLTWGGRGFINGEPTQGGTPTSIFKCPVAFILSQPTCEGAAQPNANSNTNTPPNSNSHGANGQ